jgi:HAD superfamily hydrolase (TIGR01549 family)
MGSQSFGCILFDWDLTLVRVMGDVSQEERLAALFQNEGLPYTLREIQNAVRVYQDDLQNGRIQRPGLQQTEKEIGRYYRDVLLRLGHKEHDWERLSHFYDAFAQLPYLPYDETLPVLQTLQERGLKIGLISNHSRLIRPVMERLLGEVIPTSWMFISQEVGAHKPAKRIYRHACARMRVPTQATMFVGDHLLVDAVGAVEAGGLGRGLWLDRKGSDEGETAVFPPNVSRITDLWQVLEYV